MIPALTTAFGIVDLLVAPGSDLRGHHAELGDGALHVADLRVVAWLQRAGVGEHEAAHHLVHEAARAERDDQADEDAHAFEGVGAAAGQIRIGDDQREDPDQGRDQPPGRRRLRPADRRHVDASVRDGLEEEGHEPDDEPGHEEDDCRGEEARERIQRTESESRQRGGEEAAEPLAPRARQGKLEQDVAHPDIERPGAEPADDEFGCAARHVEQPGRTKQRQVGADARPEQQGFGGRQQAGGHPAREAAQDDQRDREQRRGQQRTPRRGRDPRRVPGLGGLGQRQLHATDHRGGQRRQVDLVAPDVLRHDPENVAAGDGDDRRAEQFPRGHRPGDVVLDQPRQDLAGGCGPLGGIAWQDGGPEREDQTVAEPELRVLLAGHC